MAGTSDLIRVVDAGCYPIDGGVPYASLRSAGLANVIGIEPQPFAYSGEPIAVLPWLIGDGGQRTLNVCYAPGMSSIFELNTAVADLFPGFDAWGKVLDRWTMKTRRIDDIAEIDGFDFLKADVQGAELLVLQGAREKLKDAVAVEVEVSFLPLYKDAPLFADVDAELRSQDFWPHVISRLDTRLLGVSAQCGGPQLVQADIVYVKHLIAMERLSDAQLTKLALIAEHCYSSTELVNLCRVRLAARLSDHPAVAVPA